MPTRIRDDGSLTYAKMPYDGFFPRHDLMHYAVETTLNYREAFFGLIASGWTIESFTEPGMAKRLPMEARHTEFLVEQLEREHRFGDRSTAEEFNATISASIRLDGSPPLRPIRQDELDAIRLCFKVLLAKYTALADGEHLEIEWKVLHPTLGTKI